MPTTADIRRFIMDIFSDEELTTFCFDNFPDVQNNFTSGMTKGDKALRLLDYCQRRERLPDLLKCLRTERPAQFDARLGPSAAPQSSQPAGATQPEQNAANISGGINLQAQEVSVGGDVTGRDKIMQAGGHIIIAGQGATVIVGKDVPEGEQPAKQDVTSKASATARIENPFYTAGRINDPKLFFGREQLVRELRQELSKRVNVSLVGESQTGKSSLLYYLYKTRGEWLPGEAIEYVDLQQVLDEADFCEMILKQLSLTGNTLRDLRYTLGSHRVILLLDEVERLAEPDFSPRLHDLLRSLAQEPNFKMCVASQRPLEQVFPPRGTLSDLHNIFTRKTIGPFTENEARRFLAARLQGTGIAFTERDVARLIAESNCHPAKLQQAAKALFDEHAEG
jgi:hypothetical protein